MDYLLAVLERVAISLSVLAGVVVVWFIGFLIHHEYTGGDGKKNELSNKYNHK